MQEHTITSDDEGMRLDRFIRRHLEGITQGRIEKLLRRGAIRVDKAKAKSSNRLSEGQVVTLPSETTLDSPMKPKAKPRPDEKIVKILRNSVIARGEGWLAINKPSGLASQGGANTKHHIDGALAEAFSAHSEDKPRLVHRLDKDTSGVMVIATNLATSRKLAQGFKAHDHSKIYLALVLGEPKKSHGTINTPLAKKGGKGHEKVTADTEGQQAITKYQTLETFGIGALVALHPLTGRTHQLRAHMAHLGHPILGDGKYGGRKVFPHPSITRLCLHAAYLRFNIGKNQEITAPLPDDLMPVMEFFGLDIKKALAQTSAPNLFRDTP